MLEPAFLWQVFRIKVAAPVLILPARASNPQPSSRHRRSCSQGGCPRGRSSTGPAGDKLYCNDHFRRLRKDRRSRRTGRRRRAVSGSAQAGVQAAHRFRTGRRNQALLGSADSTIQARRTDGPPGHRRRQLSAPADWTISLGGAHPGSPRRGRRRSSAAAGCGRAGGRQDVLGASAFGVRELLLGAEPILLGPAIFSATLQILLVGALRNALAIRLGGGRVSSHLRRGTCDVELLLFAFRHTLVESTAVPSRSTAKMASILCGAASGPKPIDTPAVMLTYGPHAFRRSSAQECGG